MKESLLPSDLVHALQSRGCHLAVDGDRLLVRGPISDEDRATLARSKASILAYLTSQEPREGALPGREAQPDPGTFPRSSVAILASSRSCFGPCPSCRATDWVARVPLTCRACGYQEPERFAPRPAGSAR